MTNVVVLTGRLGADPELRRTNGGDSVTNFRMANNRSQDKTLWKDVVVFGKTAELCVEYLKKGSLVTVTGSLEPDSYEKNGVIVNKDEIRAFRVDFGPKEVESGDGSSRQAVPKPPVKATDDYQFTPDDTLPF